MFIPHFVQLVQKLSLVAGRFGDRVVSDLFLVVLNESVVGQYRFRPDSAHVVAATGQQRVGNHSSVMKSVSVSVRSGQAEGAGSSNTLA